MKNPRFSVGDLLADRFLINNQERSSRGIIIELCDVTVFGNFEDEHQIVPDCKVRWTREDGSHYYDACDFQYLEEQIAQCQLRHHPMKREENEE